jgi:hypothetical protein
MNYNPSRWLLIKINGPTPVYKVFATWGGGYLDGDSWRMNSGVIGVTEDKDFYYFEGHSGSIYQCRKTSYGCTGYGTSVLGQLVKRLESNNVTVDVLPLETDFIGIKYKI